ncbi:MAG: T9SS type A sorting domain-containing protein, partial [Bacteroidia bacterium]
TYTCIVKDNNGCIGSGTGVISQPAPLQVSLDSSITGTCSSSVWAVVQGGTPSYTYFWNPGSQTTDTITNLCQGTYKVTVTDSKGCKVMDSLFVNPPPTGIVNMLMGHGVTTFPVPASVSLEVVIKDNNFKPASYTLYDLAGKTLQEKLLTIGANSFSIDVSELNNGTYLLMLSGSDSRQTLRFIVQH